MTYVWSRHAAFERLPERSGLTQGQVEDFLEQRRYIIERRENEEHHLIWDPVRQHLIDVPVVLEQQGRVIPTILPVTYGSGYAEWRRAEAERAWRGDEFYRPRQAAPESLCTADVLLAKRHTKPSGHREYVDLCTLFTWPIFDEEAARTGDEGVIALYRDREFCNTAKVYLCAWSREIREGIAPDTPVLHIKKPGAYRHVPLDFFLRTP